MKCVLEQLINIKLKQVRNSTGLCACCEDPMTNLLNLFKQKQVTVVIPPVSTINAIIFDVGEGIVNFENTLYTPTGVINQMFLSKRQQFNELRFSNPRLI
ncbi:hypothetical protein [Chengkuizengella axinellae]|uniref:Uncharacterized protein n=1 Tax=Chengkuizengella axinellae TaxID=3064388 RepID=A0ABT9IV56_9BACL|nr:hypothetical protein [Chengkuizengella sp. 2205SS18-9]MDP5273249.1 hypothetical protein [Chengkuizengella sp. 2205SS18-9]